MSINSAMNWLRTQIPISRFSPLRTFPQRCLQKFLLFHGKRFGIVGATPVGYSDMGNRLLRLKFRSPLGPKNFQIEIPEDSAMYDHVRRSGCWDTLSSYFLAQGLLSQGSSTGRTAFVDLGANVGLVTLQTHNYARERNSFLLVEPIPSHINAIRHNTRHLNITNELRIFDFALATQDGESEIFTEKGNHGNSSFLESAFSNEEKLVTNVERKSAKSFFLQHLIGFDVIVLKSDLQGMDAEVLKEMPRGLWAKVERAVVEVWALPEIRELEVDYLVRDLWSKHKFGWTQNSVGSLTPDEVIRYWVSKTKTSQDLFIKRR